MREPYLVLFRPAIVRDPHHGKPRAAGFENLLKWHNKHVLSNQDFPLRELLTWNQVTLLLSGAFICYMEICENDKFIAPTLSRFLGLVRYKCFHFYCISVMLPCIINNYINSEQHNFRITWQQCYTHSNQMSTFKDLEIVTW